MSCRIRGFLNRRVFSSLTLLFILFLISCAQRSYNSKILEAETREMFPVPEYAPNQAIVLSIEGVDSFAKSDTGFEPYLQELLAMGFPKIVIVDGVGPDLYPAARMELAKILKKSELARARVLTLAVGTGGTRYIRDWLGLPLSDGNRVEVMNFRYSGSGDDTQEQLFQRLGVHLRSSEKFFEGGNFTNDSKGNCFLGEGGASPRYPARLQKVNEDLLRLGCKTATFLPQLGKAGGDALFVGVNHIDLWMRMLSDDVVAVATLDTESFRVFREAPHEFMKDVFTSEITPELIQSVVGDFEELQSLLDSGADLLKKAGKRVIRIPHPVPISGTLEPFLNAVQVGNRLLLSGMPPSVMNIGGRKPDLLEAVKRRVVDALKVEGYEAKFFDATPLMDGNGALHCGSGTMPASLFEAR